MTDTPTPPTEPGAKAWFTRKVRSVALPLAATAISAGAAAISVHLGNGAPAASDIVWGLSLLTDGALSAAETFAGEASPHQSWLRTVRQVTGGIVYGVPLGLRLETPGPSPLITALDAGAGLVVTSFLRPLVGVVAHIIPMGAILLGNGLRVVAEQATRLIARAARPPAATPPGQDGARPRTTVPLSGDQRTL